MDNHDQDQRKNLDSEGKVLSNSPPPDSEAFENIISSYGHILSEKETQVLQTIVTRFKDKGQENIVNLKGEINNDKLLTRLTI